MKIPKSFPVQPLRAGQQAKDRATCGTCGRSWDDGKVTGMTPAPSGRCPFESFHEVSAGRRAEFEQRDEHTAKDYERALMECAERGQALARARRKLRKFSAAAALAAGWIGELRAAQRRWARAEYTDSGEAAELLERAAKVMREATRTAGARP